MTIDIGKTLSLKQLQECQYLGQHLTYDIYCLEISETYFFATDSTGLICGFFEFVEIDDGYQLAHMHTLVGHKKKGIGTRLMQEGVKMFCTFHLPSTDTTHPYYFIEDGLGFTLACFDKKILVSPPFKKPNGYEYLDSWDNMA